MDLGVVGAGGANGALVGGQMAPFLTKLYQIVSAPTTDHCINWTPKGDSFVISDPDTFARDILPTYFKHNNIRSFIRQLNTYGFRKRTNISSTDEHLEFFHAKFRRDDPAQLAQIKRCHQSKPQAPQPRSAPSGGGNPGNPGALMSLVPNGMADLQRYNPDLDTICGRVTELKTRLGSLQTEIRDYNQQMEQKVNLLMHILQTSSTPGPVGNNMMGGQGVPRVPTGGSSAVPSSHMPPTSQAASNAPPGQNGSAQQSAAGASSSPADMIGRRDALLASLGQQSLAGGLGLGLGPSLGGNLGGLGGLGGLGNVGVGGGVGGLMGQPSLGGLGLGNGMLGNLGLGAGGLGSLNGALKGATDAAGLQHLLEAAQQQSTEEAPANGGDRDRGGDEQGRMKRFCPNGPDAPAGGAADVVRAS